MTASGGGDGGTGREGVLLDFFYRLRDHGLRVTPQQWLTVLEGLSKGLHGSSLAGLVRVIFALPGRPGMLPNA